MSKDALIYRLGLINDALYGLSAALGAVANIKHDDMLQYAALSLRHISNYTDLTHKQLEEKEKTDE